MATPIEASKELINLEDIDAGTGVSRELLRKLGASINSIVLNSLFPIGTPFNHAAPPTEFALLMGNAWVLEDGSDVTETDWGQFVINNNITEYISAGRVYLPDSRGMWELAHNAGRTDGNQLFESLDVGAFHEGDNKAHRHLTVTDYTELTQRGLTANNSIKRTKPNSNDTDYELVSNFDDEGADPTLGRTSSNGHAQNTVNSIIRYRYFKVWNEAQPE